MAQPTANQTSMFEPEALSFTPIPDPPRIPHDHLGLDYWHRHAEEATATRTSDDLGYKTRYINRHDPSGEGKWKESDWPVDLLLGPPSKAPDWNPLLNKFGAQVLDDAGFINYYGELKSLMLPFGKLAATHADNPIHPVFRMDRWLGVHPDEYRLLQPVIRLAGAVLDDPGTLRFLWALYKKDTMTRKHAEGFGEYDVFSIPDHLTPQQEKEIQQVVFQMRDHVEFCFSSVDSLMSRGVLALTTPQIDAEGQYIKAAGQGSWKSRVHLPSSSLMAFRLYHDQLHDPTNTEMKDWLEQIWGLSATPPERRIELDLLSANMRAFLMLTQMLLHEFAHAFGMAHYQTGNNPTREPFLEGDRVTELGFAFTQHVWKACLEGPVFILPPLDAYEGLYQSCLPPLCLFFENRWDFAFEDQGPGGAVRAVEPPDPNETKWMFPVPQEGLHKLFFEWTWEKAVARWGLDAIQFRKLDKWGVPFSSRSGIFGTHPERWQMSAS